MIPGDEAVGYLQHSCRDFTLALQLALRRSPILIEPNHFPVEIEKVRRRLGVRGGIGRPGMVSSLLGSGACQPGNVYGPQQPVLLNHARKLRTHACSAAFIDYNSCPVCSDLISCCAVAAVPRATALRCDFDQTAVRGGLDSRAFRVPGFMPSPSLSGWHYCVDKPSIHRSSEVSDGAAASTGWTVVETVQRVCGAAEQVRLTV
jgi:hypothetical protein